MKELEIKLLESQISANKERQRTDAMFLRQDVRVGHVEDRVSFVEEEVSIQRAQNATPPPPINEKKHLKF